MKVSPAFWRDFLCVNVNNSLKLYSGKALCFSIFTFCHKRHILRVEQKAFSIYFFKNCAIFLFKETTSCI